MIIPIDDKYRLKSDIDQWLLQKFTPTKKEPNKWQSFKFFSNPSSAVTALIQLRIRESEVETLIDALAEVDRVTASVLQALTPVFEVQEK